MYFLLKMWAFVLPMWAYVLVGFCPRGFCPRGFCLRGFCPTLELNSSAVNYQVQLIHRLQMAFVTLVTCVFFFAKIYNLTDAKS